MQHDSTDPHRQGCAGCEWKPDTEHAAGWQAGPLLFFFFLVESYPSLVVKQHFQEEESLEENTDLPWGEGFSPISAVQLRGILPVFLIMYTTGDFAKGWKEGATGAGRRLR